MYILVYFREEAENGAGERKGTEASTPTERGPSAIYAATRYTRIYMSARGTVINQWIINACDKGRLKGFYR